MTDELKYSIAFSMLRGINGNTARTLLQRVGSSKAFFEFKPNELALLTGSNSDIFSNDYRQKVLADAEREANFIEINKIRHFFITDADYPRRLENCDDCPTMAYALGRCDFGCRHTVGIVGTRHATNYGIEFTRRLVADLAKLIPGICIVSGLAYGIDVAAHQAALDAGTPTVGVLAHGLNMIYPAEHRSVAAKMVESGGGLVTEYPSSAKIYKQNFLKRNRIVAALSDALVVVESDYRGGSLSTARIASLYNRDVFAVPGRVTDTYSRGTNALIANNTAAVITSADDLVKQMGWATAPVPEQPRLFTPLTPELQQILDCIAANPEVTANDLCVRLGISFATLTDRLFRLEMEEAITTLPGGRFAVRR